MVNRTTLSDSAARRRYLAYAALAMVVFMLAHAVGQLAEALLSGKPWNQALPVIEKPVADLGKLVGTALTGWVPDVSLPTPLGPLAVRYTAAYTVYEWVKLPILLFLTTFGMTLLRLKAGVRRIEKTLGRDDLFGVLGGTALGMFTPVCSCTVTNLYAGLVAGGASRRASAAFLFASPALNEFAIIFMFIFGGLWGGVVYVVAGVLASIATAYLSPLLGLNPQHFIASKQNACSHQAAFTNSIIERAFEEASVLFKRLFVPVLISGALAGLLVNFNLTVVQVLQRAQFQWWGPIVATLAGLPLDVNAAATAPILAAVRNFVPLGTLVSAMMATTVSSIPEVTMLSRLLSRRSALKVVAWYAAYTMAIGLLINTLFAGV
ncbi:MAG: permease [Chloroflexi bacterium]|jgi:uncharacterized membrane protein YraQ (UPF0718 family)|uniref:Permease n=1 Tax=Candidatus Thermofonsia Clade 3 bacterium TaxID=2364212 RepID=A0A2M8QE82_9CHLR|nr:permease [Candidatus Roseilinea sp. NK_OTU-006]PJF48062.1 MAG: permease [Candidatus Thermofonsia Clade 3 bacterium]RMG63702.1 MAG: permease [Chloroflexota bacterium]